MPEIRPFARHDRHGLADLANAHLAGVLPGGSIPTSTLLSQMEHDPDEYIVDPWVIDRRTIVGISAGRVVAAAHVKRYDAGAVISEDYRDVGEIGWLLCWPDSLDAGRRVLATALDQLRAWHVRVWYAEGNLPGLGAYGVSEAWPHVADLLVDAGFAPTRTDVLLVGSLADLTDPGPAPVDDLAVHRRVGRLGVRFDAEVDGEIVGCVELDDGHSKGGSVGSLTGWADVANHWVVPTWRGRGIGTWIFRHGCGWLRLGGTTRLLAYATEAEADDAIHYYARHAIHEIGRTRRGWTLDPG